MNVIFPYFGSGGADYFDGEVSVPISEEEWNRLCASGGFHLSGRENLRDIQEKVMDAVKLQEVNTYKEDDDLLKCLTEDYFFDGDIADDDIWNCITDKYRIGINFPKELQHIE